MDRIVIAMFAFLFGAGTMLHAWQRDAERGVFEVGGIVYKVERILP